MSKWWVVKPMISRQISLQELAEMERIKTVVKVANKQFADKFKCIVKQLIAFRNVKTTRINIAYCTDYYIEKLTSMKSQVLTNYYNEATRGGNIKLKDKDAFTLYVVLMRSIHNEYLNPFINSPLCMQFLVYGKLQTV